MYLPKLYQVTDEAVIDKFIQQNSFATLVSCDRQTPVATHLPLELAQDASGAKFLHGHLARANKQWQTFDFDTEVLAIFSGPHTYVSARWYNHVNVPTWNYMVVHAYGRPRLVTDHDELYAMLKQLVDRYEAHAVTEKPYRLDTLPPDYIEKEMRGIVGFEIKVNRLEAKFKLSQNRHQQDYDHVIAELQKSGDSNARAVAGAMAEHRDSVFGG
ncbi:MAG: Protease synthase and sporulation protein PAI 2 [bacterium]|nr:Protease synthase and sporulation protein PAI 2 [bacterium]